MAPSPPDERKLLEMALTGEEPAPAPSSSPAPSPTLSGSKRRGSDSSLGSMIKDLAVTNVDDGGSGSDVEVLPEPPKQRRRSLTPNRRVGLPQALKANKIKEETRASDEPLAGYGIVAKLVYGDEEKWDVIQYDVIEHMRKNWDEYAWVLKNGPDGAEPPAGGHYSSMAAYLRFMPNAVIDDAEIQAIQRLYNLHLDLIRYNDGELTPDNHLLIPIDDYLRESTFPPRLWRLLRVAKTGFGTWMSITEPSTQNMMRVKPVSWTKSLQKRLADEGFNTVIEKGDGNCQFRAIARRRYEDPEKHMKVRGEIITYLRENRDDFAPNMVGLAVRPAERVADMNAAFDAYVKRMSLPDQWGDDATLLAATRLYGFGAIVYRAHDMERMNFSLDDQPGAPLHLLWNGGHYDTLERPALAAVPMPVPVPGVRLAPVRPPDHGSERDPAQDIVQRHHNLMETRETERPAVAEAAAPVGPLPDLDVVWSQSSVDALPAVTQAELERALELYRVSPVNQRAAQLAEAPVGADALELHELQPEPPSGFNPVEDGSEFFRNSQ